MRWRDFYRERRPEPEWKQTGPREWVSSGELEPHQIARLVRDWLEQEADSGNSEIEPAALNHVAFLFHQEAFYVD